MDGYLGRQIHKGKMSAKRIIQVDEVLDEDKKKDTTRAENRKLHKDCQVRAKDTVNKVGKVKYLRAVSSAEVYEVEDVSIHRGHR